jgi:FAD/FMN-containing dehydrogenase
LTVKANGQKGDKVANLTIESLDALRAELSGVLGLPGEPDYEEAVSIWNAAIPRRPGLVARCVNSRDVSAALGFASREGLEVSVRGGGHNYAGCSLSDGGLMIDLTPMKSVVVDPELQRAKCGGGTTWGELDAATQAHGLAVPGGFISRTGVGGLTLGGGFGWLSRLAGLSSDNLAGAEIVTADGRVLHASERDNTDLFWAIRGGGGNFGVVTEFEFDLHRVGPMLQLGLFLFRPDQGGDLLRFARSFVDGLPNECGVFLAGLSAPPEPFVPTELQFTPVYALVVVGFGDEEEHARLIQPIKEALAPIVELVTPIPYVGLQQMFDASAPWGMHSYEKAVYLAELSDGAIDTILEHQAKKMSPLSFVPIFVLGGAYQQADGSATAFGGSRDLRYIVNISATAMSPDDYEAERAWSRDYWADLVQHAVGIGSYVNFMTDYEDDRVRSAYGPKFERLQQVKALYDPNNVFHLNANIPPAR